jgi:hypothetical protein
MGIDRINDGTDTNAETVEEKPNRPPPPPPERPRNLVRLIGQRSNVSA